MSARLVVLASGSGTNLQAMLDAADDGRLPARVELVVVNRRSAGARHRARAAGVADAYRPLAPYLEGGEHPADGRRRYDRNLAATVGSARPDLVVLAGWMHVLSSAFLDAFPNRVVNLHPALPGEFPGASAIDDAWAAFRRGEIDRTGVMVHFVPDEGVDCGPVIATRTVAISRRDSHEHLTSRIHEAEHELLVDAIVGLLASVA